MNSIRTGLRPLAAAFALLLASCAGGPPRPEHARVLIVTGEDYEGHRWTETAPVLESILAADPRLSVETIQDLTLLCSDRVRDADVIVLHFKNYDPEVPGRAGFDALESAVEQGTGLVLVHFACGAFQEFAAEFEALAGRVWDPALRGHDPHGAFTVEIVDAAHPVTRGLADFDTTDELYTCLAGTTPIHVLAEARSVVDGVRYPMAFVLDHGAGRVFHTPLGHDVAAFRTSGTAALLRRGTAWAAGLSVVDLGVDEVATSERGHRTSRAAW